jgi:hypothetical protein
MNKRENRMETDLKAIRAAFKQCHSDPDFRVRFITECRKQIGDKTASQKEQATECATSHEPSNISNAS